MELDFCPCYNALVSRRNKLSELWCGASWRKAGRRNTSASCHWKWRSQKEDASVVVPDSSVFIFYFSALGLWAVSFVLFVLCTPTLGSQWLPFLLPPRSGIWLSSGKQACGVCVWKRRPKLVRRKLNCEMPFLVSLTAEDSSVKSCLMLWPEIYCFFFPFWATAFCSPKSSKSQSTLWLLKADAVTSPFTVRMMEGIGNSFCWGE